MKALFLAALTLGMCSNPDIDSLEEKIDRLTAQQQETNQRLNRIERVISPGILSDPEGAAERTRQHAVKANMHTFQTMVETYAVDWGGVYPANLSELLREAQAKRYEKSFSNPYTKQVGPQKSIADGFATSGCQPGVVYYQSPVQVIDQQSGPYTYEISGCQGTQQPIAFKGRPFILSNA